MKRVKRGSVLLLVSFLLISFFLNQYFVERVIFTKQVTDLRIIETLLRRKGPIHIFVERNERSPKVKITKSKSQRLTSEPSSSFLATQLPLSSVLATQSPPAENDSTTSNVRFNRSKARMLTKSNFGQPLGDRDPIFKTNPQKFLFPSLGNGPSNQMFGFYQSIFLSIMLNRTLVIPWFHRHAFAGQERPKFRVENRLNIEILGKLVSIISMEEAKKMCHNTFDAFFHAADLGQMSLLKNLIKTHLETDMRGLNYKEDVNMSTLQEFIKSGRNNFIELFSNKSKSGKDCFPSLTGPFHRGARWKENTSLTEILSSYQSNASCVFYCCPFRQLRISPLKELPASWPRSEKDIILDPLRNVVTKEDAGIIWKKIVLHTPPIQLVLDIEKMFRNQVLKRENKTGFLAVHWRYDKPDYLKYLCEDHYSEKRKYSCDNVKRALNSSAFAQAIANKVSDLQNAGNRIASVYVATPLTLKNYVEETKKKFAKLVPSRATKLFCVDDLEKFISKRNFKTRYGSLIHEEDGLLSDILSEIEIELCARSNVFVWSKQSTWSQRALLKRDFVYSKPNPDGQHVIKMVLKVIDGPNSKKYRL